MTDYDIYFGTPGSLVMIEHPRGGLRAPRERPRSVFKTGAGGARVGSVVGGKRVYTLDYRGLMEETYSVLAAYEQGHRGPGPWALLDPGQRNQLGVNQSAATSERNDTNNFTIAGSGHTIASSTAQTNETPRSLYWVSTFAAVTGTLTLDNLAPDDWYGIPVVLRPYTFSFYAKGGGSDAVVDLIAKITWYTSAGAVVSTSSGTATATNGSTWTAVSVTATAPATTAYAICSVEMDDATVSAGAAVYLDSFQFEEGSAATDWRPGTGVYPVQFSLSTNDQWPWAATAYRVGPTFTLQETGG